MARADDAGGKGVRSGLGMTRAIAAGLVLSSLSLSSPAVEPCSPAMAKVVSVQGSAERRIAEDHWAELTAEATLCPGDTVRANRRSRVALLLANQTALRLDENTTLTLTPTGEREGTLIRMLRGGLLVLTRTPRPFTVVTPFVNAGVEGTEFSLRVLDDRTTISVFEGRVAAGNDHGSVKLADGESATAGRGAAPRTAPIVRPVDAVNWALYVPALFDHPAPAQSGNPSAAEQVRARSVELYRSGRLDEALAALESTPDAAAIPGHLAAHAGLLMMLGRLEEARAEIAGSLRVAPAQNSTLALQVTIADPRASDAHALQAMLAVVEDDKDAALESARRAVDLDPKSPSARIAMSYAQQARFEIDEALASARTATELAPNSALAQARLAELELSLANLDAALQAAQEAVRLDPGLGKTQAVLGFANLLRVDTAAAMASFSRAIVLEPASPWPWLGLGLARIREGDIEAGRSDIEVAAILDPRNSLVRSYLGKAYYEERRDKLAGSQFGLAKELDPNDPTPYLYDAILKQTSNRPVEALRDLNRSIALNDNRAVYRSRFLLDDDRAARTTSLAATYGELGFERLAIVESVKALADNPGNGAAHQQLARAYADLPRHDIARVSEALQAQIRQPLTLSPIDPQLGTDNLGILRGSGPSRLGTNEFNQLFARDQLRLQLDGVAGSRGTVGDQIVLSGVSGPLAFAASQLHHETDGFGENNAARKNALDAFVQGQLTPAASMQVGVGRSDVELGTTFFPFDDSVILPTAIKERSDVARISGHFAADAVSDWVVSVARERRTRLAETFPDGLPITETHARIDAVALQRLDRIGTVQLIAGAEVVRERDLFPFEQIDVSTDSQTLYAYGHWRVDRGRLSVLGGLALEHVEIRNSLFPESIERGRASPKLGVVWSPRPETTVRAALFSAVKRPFVRSQTLEPTQVAGFTQFFTGFDAFYGDIDATVSRRAGVAIDHRLSTDRFVGAELSARQLDVPQFVPARDFRWNERTAHAYLYDARLGQPYIAPGWSVAASADYDYELIVRPQTLPGPEGIVRVMTHRLPLGVRLFRGPYVLRAGTTYVRQGGVFSASEFNDRFAGSSRGWITDVAADYRLPARTGTLGIGVRNALDKKLDLFQIDPFNPRDAAGRFVYARLRVVF